MEATGQEASLVAPEPLQQQESLSSPSTLGVARKPSGGGQKAGKASWLLVCRHLANQLARFSFFFLFFFYFIQGGHSKKGGKKRDFSTPTFKHAPLSCPFLVTVTMSFRGSLLQLLLQLPAKLWNSFFFLPNFGVVSGAHLHMAGVKMFASLSYFIMSSAYIFLRKNRMFPACYTEIVKFNFTFIFTLFLSHTVTHTQEHKSLGAQ